MTVINSMLVVISLFFIQSCSNKATSYNNTTKTGSSTSYELSNGDTINRTDISGNKQGHWQIRKAIACTKTVMVVYNGEADVHTEISNGTDLVRIEQGNYLNNKKEGVWETFYPSGKLKNSVLYKNDVVIK